MYSEKRTLFGTFLFFLIAIISVVLFAFSISDALEGEVVEPANPEEAVTEVVTPEEGTPEEALPTDPVTDISTVGEEATEDKQLKADPSSGPLYVYYNGSLASDSECDWNSSTNVYTIYENNLTFTGKGTPATCSIETANGEYISNITFNNVTINSDNSDGTIILTSNGNLTINIINSCSISNSTSYGINAKDNSEATHGPLEITGNSSSSLTIYSSGSSINSEYYSSNKISGGLLLNVSTTGSYALNTEANDLIFDTTGNVVLSAPSGEAILGTSQNFKLSVNKGYVELHGKSDKDAYYAAINSLNHDVNNIIHNASTVKTVGAESTNATLAQCKEGVYMKRIKSDYNAYDFCLPYIGDAPCGTVIFTDSLPTPGGGASETAQTGDSIPAGAIALISLIALGSFVALRSRKSTF